MRPDLPCLESSMLPAGGGTNLEAAVAIVSFTDWGSGAGKTNGPKTRAAAGTAASWSNAAMAWWATSAEAVSDVSPQNKSGHRDCLLTSCLHSDKTASCVVKATSNSPSRAQR
jgi:hypothetical protein